MRFFINRSCNFYRKSRLRGDRKLRNIPHELNSLIGKSIQQGIPDDIDEYEPEELEDPELDYRTLM